MGRKLCDPCKSVARERRHERRRAYERAYFQANRERRQAQSKAWVSANPERAAELKRASYQRDLASGKRTQRNLAVYGLTVEDFNALLAAQGGVCAICGREQQKRRFNVDHDHATGIVRGVLCTPCNGVLGRYRDSVEEAKKIALYYERRATRVRSAIAYLENPPAADVLGQEAPDA